MAEGPGVAPGEHTGAARRRSRARPGSFALSMLGAAARGTGLIAVAVAIGVVLLQYSDNTGDQLAGERAPRGEAPAAPLESTSTTTTTAGPRPPSEMTVLVLNASGRAGQAKAMSDRLAVVGYRTLEPGNADGRVASEVSCRNGLDREAAALVAATGLPAETDELTAESAPPDAVEADCVVIVGSG